MANDPEVKAALSHVVGKVSAVGTNIVQLVGGPTRGQLEKVVVVGEKGDVKTFKNDVKTLQNDGASAGTGAGAGAGVKPAKLEKLE